MLGRARRIAKRKRRSRRAIQVTLKTAPCPSDEKRTNQDNQQRKRDHEIDDRGKGTLDDSQPRCAIACGGDRQNQPNQNADPLDHVEWLLLGLLEGSFAVVWCHSNELRIEKALDLSPQIVHRAYARIRYAPSMTVIQNAMLPVGHERPKMPSGP